MDSPLLTITIASAGRKQKLVDCIQSVDYPNIQLCIGSISSQDIPVELMNQRTDILTLFSPVKDPVKIQNRLAGLSAPGSHILYAADDIQFDPGAIQSAIDALVTHFPDGDGTIGLNVKNMTLKQKCSYAFMLVGNKFFNERLHRQLFYPQYRHFYADMELGEFAGRIGKFYFCEEAKLTHFHPSTGAPADETHIRNRQEKWEHDHKLYQERKLQFSKAMDMQ